MRGWGSRISFKKVIIEAAPNRFNPRSSKTKLHQLKLNTITDIAMNSFFHTQSIAPATCSESQANPCAVVCTFRGPMVLWGRAYTCMYSRAYVCVETFVHGCRRRAY